MIDAGLRPARAMLHNSVRRYTLRQMMMPDSLGGGRMLETGGSVVQRMEGIDELIPEEFLEWMSYEGTMLPMSQESRKGNVII